MVYLLYITTFLHFLLGLLILVRNYKDKSNITFSIFLIGIASWSFANAQFQSAESESNMFSWALIAYTAATLMLFFMVLFSNYIVYEKIKNNKIFLYTTFFISLIIPYIPDLVIKSVDFEKKAIIGGPLLGLLFITYVVLIGTSIKNLIDGVRGSSGLKRKQLNLVTIGLIAAVISGVTTNLVLPALNNYKFVSLGPSFTLISLSLVAFAIIRYKFLDIRIFVGRLSYYFLLSLIVLITYRVVLLSNNFIWGSALDVRGMLTGAVFAFIFVIFYDQFKTFVQSRITSVLINPGFEPNEVIVSFNKTISTLLDYEEIANLLDLTIMKTIRPDAITVFVKLEDKGKFILKADSDQTPISLNYENIYKLWGNSSYIPIFLDQIELEVPRKFSVAFHELSLVVEEMRQKKVRLILPIGIKENSNGLLILGSKEGDSTYNSIQIKFLESLCEITALALIRAKLYEEVQEFNETLQQKVKDATLEIQSQNSKLSEALRIERDMLDVLGHELRTPLGTIRNAMGVVDLKYKSKQFTNADLEGFLKVGTENIRREIQLLETILASAKIDNDKLDMNFEKVDSNDVVADSFEAYKYDAEKKGLKLIQTLPPEIVYSYADRLRIQQVMDNLVSNSIKYTEKGQVELKVVDEGKYVRFFVTDTGEGIPEEDIAKLGTKFFRANMYLKSDGKLGDRRIVRPGGTGIGLYVVYQIVKFMYGEVKVTSKIGEGSTFSFTVLKYTPELENRNSFILAGKDSVRTYNNETRE